jgi:YggT family protein
MKGFFSLLSSAATVYTLACCIRIWLTWAPGLAMSAPGRFLAQACDPYLSAFRRFRFLRVGTMDFSPAVGVAVLLAISSVANGLAQSARFSLGILAAQLVSACWGMVSALLSMIIILLVIRLIAALLAPRSTYNLWTVLDRSLSPFVEGVRVFLHLNRMVWSALLAITLLACLLISGLGNFLATLVTRLLIRLPF